MIKKQMLFMVKLPWHIKTEVRSKRQHTREDEKYETKRTWQKSKFINAFQCLQGS